MSRGRSGSGLKKKELESLQSGATTAQELASPNPATLSAIVDAK